MSLSLFLLLFYFSQQGLLRISCSFGSFPMFKPDWIGKISAPVPELWHYIPEEIILWILYYLFLWDGHRVFQVHRQGAAAVPSSSVWHFTHKRNGILCPSRNNLRLFPVHVKLYSTLLWHYWPCDFCVCWCFLAWLAPAYIKFVLLAEFCQLPMLICVLGETPHY